MQRPAYSTGLGHEIPADLTVLGLLWGVILDIRAALDCGSPPEARLSAIRAHLDERVPGGSAGNWPLSPLGPGSTAADAAGMIGAALAWQPGPATAAFGELAGVPARIEITDAGLRPAGAAEGAALGLRPGTQVYARSGLMVAGRVTCARTHLVLAPELLPRRAWDQIRGGEAAGRALAAYGFTRGRRTADVTPGGDPAVRASARLALCGVSVGTAAEDVTAELCEYLAARAAGA